MVVLIPVPVFVIVPVKLDKVQVPVAGKLLNITFPVGNSQVGCVILPGTGIAGIDRFALMVTLADTSEMHPPALVTV